MLIVSNIRTRMEDRGGWVARRAKPATRIFPAQVASHSTEARRLNIHSHLQASHPLWQCNLTTTTTQSTSPRLYHPMNDSPSTAHGPHDAESSWNPRNSYEFMNHSNTSLPNLQSHIDDKPLARQKRKRTRYETRIRERGVVGGEMLIAR